MPFLNHRLRTLQTESFRNLGAAFSPSLFLFLSLNFVPKYLKISFLPLCIYKNVEKNRAKTGHFLLQFLPSNHNILWSNMPIFLIFHNTASELPTPHAMSVQFRCITHDLFVKSWFENDATVPYRTCKIKHDAPLCTCHSKRLDLFLRYSSN